MKIWLRSLGAFLMSPFVYLRMVFHVRGMADVMSRTLLRAGVAVAGAAAAMAMLAVPDAHAACRGQISSGTVVTGSVAYDPFGPADFASGSRIVVSNTGGETCSYALVFRSAAVTPRLGNTLAYVIDNASMPSLITNASPALAPAARTLPIAAANKGNIDYRVVIPRGQFAAPADNYSDTLTLELYALDANGGLLATKLHVTTLKLTYSVAAILSVNISGADVSSTTVNLGTLTSGQQANVEIQARANQAFQLNVTSLNRGVMALTPKVATNWSVPYTATLGGRALNLATGTSVQSQPPTVPGSDASFPLLVTIGDVVAKRAGRYEDVITIEIKAAPL